ncbi:MAG TPA: nucleotidyltransferase domain-containing protein, partial [Acidilobales archaeon]|nr:nucleotidyltransferase domain-containing protein [Acidilobales archaeon]
MGEVLLKEVWAEVVKDLINKLKTYLGSLEAVIVFGSWSRSGGGEWSDIDVLIVSDDAEKMEVLDRFLLASTLCAGKCDVFIYSYR